MDEGSAKRLAGGRHERRVRQDSLSTVVPPGTDDIEARHTIEAESGFTRGTFASIGLYSVFELLNSKAAASGGLTLTATGTNGQSGASGVAFDLSGVASMSASSFQPTIQGASSTSHAGSTLSSVPANEVVLGLFGRPQRLLLDLSVEQTGLLSVRG